MRAKLKLASVKADEYGEELEFHAVAKTGSYPVDGTDEDNTYAKFSPTADLKMRVCNPALLGTFKPGQRFYVDFTPADVPPTVE